MVKVSRKKKLILLIGAAALILITLGSMMASRKREKPLLVTTDKAFQKTITQLSLLFEATRLLNSTLDLAELLDLT